MCPALLLLPLPAAAGAQNCDQPYYRWSAKIDASLADSSPRTTYVPSILRQRTPLVLFAGDACAGRQGREVRVYSVAGWVRRVKKHEADKDWHIEITASRDALPDSCIVAEIPLADQDGQPGNYAEARRALDSLLADAPAGLSALGDVTPPVRLRFIGAAFYDGFHHTRAGGAYNHGRCNASARALWEIHPVYWVRPP
jgi:hypothetical protein